MNSHAEWFAEMGRSLALGKPEIRWGDGGHVICLPIDDPFPTRKAAEIACERACQDIDELTATAPEAVEGARHDNVHVAAR